jgi:hypothetical protein
MRHLLLGLLAVGVGVCLVACSEASSRAVPSSATSSTSPASTSSSPPSTPTTFGVSTSLSCPATVSSEGTLGNTDVPTDRLVPTNPSSGLLCRYLPLYGSTQPGYPHGHLEGDAILDAATARRSGSILNAMPNPPPGPVSCPADFGTIDLVMFQFASRPRLTVRASVSGCATFTNGVVIRSGFGRPFEEYAALVDGLVPRHDQLP